jgi:hypothetical protein
MRIRTTMNNHRESTLSMILFNLLRQAKPVTEKSTDKRHTIFMTIKLRVVKTFTSD